MGLLLAAVVSALATAYLNIEIPKSLGKLVNIVAGSFVTSGETVNSIRIYPGVLKQLLCFTKVEEIRAVQVTR